MSWNNRENTFKLNSNIKLVHMNLFVTKMWILYNVLYDELCYSVDTV